MQTYYSFVIIIVIIVIIIIIIVFLLLLLLLLLFCKAVFVFRQVDCLFAYFDSCCCLSMLFQVSEKKKDTHEKNKVHRRMT